MHGLGNDFVVIDAREGGAPVTPALARALGDRNRGIGFDQLAVVRSGEGVAAEVDFWNADGSPADACGNATRCVARMLMDESGVTALDLRTGRGRAARRGCGRRADAGEHGAAAARLARGAAGAGDGPRRAADRRAIPAPWAWAIRIASSWCRTPRRWTSPAIGPRVEHDPLFPERTNVEFVQVIDRETVRMRVWERGGMVTLACGSGACASRRW